MTDNYYKIFLSYEIPQNVLDSEDPNIVAARDRLYENLAGIIPDKYETYSLQLGLYQTQDTMNYLVSYNAYFRSIEGLPMEEYVAAREVKDKIRTEIEDFFNSVDCEYRQLNVKALL